MNKMNYTVTDAVIEACMFKDINLIKHYLTSIESVNWVDRWYDTPLHIAVRNNNAEITDLLIKNGADVNYVSWRSKTPLHSAVENGSFKIVSKLILAGANVNAKDKYGWTPLHYAADQGLEIITKKLLLSGADVNAMGDDRVTPFRLAIYHNHNSVAAAMLPYRPDVSVKTTSGSSILSLTINGCSSSAMRSFIRSLIIKEELVKTVFHPKRVEKWFELGGNNTFEMMFG